MKMIKSNSYRIKLIAFLVLMFVASIAILTFTLTQNDKKEDVIKNDKRSEKNKNEVTEKINEDLNGSTPQEPAGDTERIDVADHSNVALPVINLDIAVNNINYDISFIDSKEDGTKCKLTATDGSITLYTESLVVDTKCSGKITNSALEKGDDWTVLLTHTDKNGIETVTKKAMQII